MFSRVVTVVLVGIAARVAAADEIPRTVPEVAASFDPRAEPLDVRLVREWQADDITYRYVTYHVGTFKGTPAWVAAFYAFPTGQSGLPGLLHLHGGGQRAFLHEVEYYAKRGYACLSINWGGREMENAEPGDPNTDWGAVDPTQKNVPGYFNLKPGELYIDDVESPRNNNWYLLTLAARRGLTFLEQQPEVDADRLGVYGHSMGGSLTIYTAGTDDRVKVAAPSVGGSGFRTQPWPLLPEQQKQRIHGDVDLFNATLGFESYAPHISAPTLWLSATNDFHGIMDDLYRTGRLIPDGVQVQYAITPHMNHRFTPEFEIARPLWIDQHLKGTFTFPKRPELFYSLGKIPHAGVEADESLPIERVDVLYSVGADPQARFWRTVSVPSERLGRSVALPILSTDDPLLVYANVYYRIDPQQNYRGETETLALSTHLLTLSPEELKKHNFTATDETDNLIHARSNGWQDWYSLNAQNPHHWEYSTRKINDPKWRGEPGELLSMSIQSDDANELVVVLTENFFRSYRGPKKVFSTVARLAGGAQPQTVKLEASDFETADGQTLENWDQIDLLSLRAYYEEGETIVGSKSWSGQQPEIRRIEWELP